MKKYRFEIGLFVLYTLLALVVSYPLVLNLNNSVYGIRGDHLSQLWQDWWEKETLLSGKFPVSTSLANYPFGFDYSKAAFPLVHLALRLGLTLLTNEVLSFNIWFLLTFPLSGLAVYYLAKRLGVSKMAAAFSGLVYSFSMYHFSHAWEHSSLIFLFWMPLFVWALVKFNERRTVKNAMLAALAFTAVLLDNFYYGFLVIPFAGFFFLFQIRSWWNWRSTKLLFLFALFCLLFPTPFIFPILKAVFTGNAEGALDSGLFNRAFNDLNWLSARPWHYVLPSVWHPLWGSYSRKILDWLATKPPYFLTQPYSGKEHNIYLGWTALILSAIAIFWARQPVGLKPRNPTGFPRRRSAAFIYLFLFLGIMMMIFSAPPYATIALHKIYFPSYFTYQILPMFSAYARFGVLVLLCVAVLAGFGLDYVFSVAARFYRARSWRHKMPQLLTLLFSGLVLLEVLLPSFNVDLTPPEAYQWLKKQPGDFIVMEYPPRSDHTDLLYQRTHRKKMLDLRYPATWELLCSLTEQSCEPREVLGGVVKFPDALKKVGVRYVIFHENDPVMPTGADYFEHDGFKIVEKFPGIIVFEVVGK